MKEVKVSSEVINSIVKRIIKSINDAQEIDGHSADDSLIGALAAIGYCVGQRGVVIDPKSSIEKTLSPFIDGYRKAVDQKK
jgi:hypothetical protein